MVMDLTLQDMKIIVTIVFLGFLGVLLCLFKTLILQPERLRSQLRKQGIRGPPPSMLLGNIPDIKKIQSKVLSRKGKQEIVHNCDSTVLPFLYQWRKQYGSRFMFSLGNIQILCVTDPDVVKEISICTSLDLAKPSYQNKRNDPLLGQGIITSNGEKWVHQRKILAPEFYLDKVKGMMNLMAQSAETIVEALKNKIESEGGVADIKIDDYMKHFSGDVISRACFGGNYSQGKEIFSKISERKKAMPKMLFSVGIPRLRYLPTKTNRECWRLEKEIRNLILKVVNERIETKAEKDLLQMILESATNYDLGQAESDHFIIDNCKNIYLAGYETSAISATWTLMLLASNPEWQDKARAEVLKIFAGELPNDDKIRKLKILTMVISESLRLYPPVPLVARELLINMKFGDINVPKGVTIWTVAVHQDPEIWGVDADKFNPERFANGVTGACKHPHVYMPFGVGPRICLGQHLALAELKIVLALLLSNFEFSISPQYVHSPTMTLVLEPEYGVNLLVKKL